MSAKPMTSAARIRRPDVLALIERAASKFTSGDKTEAVALALRRLLERNIRSGSLFGVHPGSVEIRDGFDLVAPVLRDQIEAETD